MRVLVAGASGLVGYAAVKDFAARGWEVVGVSRRTPAPVEGARFVSLDLSNQASCAAGLSELGGFSHVVYAALWDGAHWDSKITERDYTEGNLSMLRNVLEPIEISSPTLEHVSVVHGTKAYGTHLDELGRIRPRMREADPRPNYPSFYFLQEDYLRERQPLRQWAWTTWRATWIFGETPGNSMNAIPALGIYGALLRERGEPLYFPGNWDWRVIREACDSELLAEALAWAAISPVARNETYNVSNGDQFDWQTVWSTIAESLGMEAGGQRLTCLEEEIPRRAEEWARIVAKYDLRSSTDPLEFGGASFGTLDQVTGYHRQSELRVQLSSIIKLRQHGFERCLDTEEMFRKWFRRLQDARMLPPVEATAAAPAYTSV